MTTLHVI